MTSLLKAYTRT